jgi:hypothetical protein
MPQLNLTPNEAEHIGYALASFLKLTNAYLKIPEDHHSLLEGRWERIKELYSDIDLNILIHIAKGLENGYVRFTAPAKPWKGPAGPTPSKEGT